MSLSLKTLYALALAYLFATVNAAAVPSLDKRSDGFLQLDFTVHTSPKPHNSTSETPDEISKRAEGYLPAALINNVNSYLADVYIGSNNQKIPVIVDTGSSDLWVSTSNTGGDFNPSTSSTYKDLGLLFQIIYGDFTYATGTFATDNVGLSANGPKVNVQFGSANQSDAGVGLLGIGYPELEGPVYLHYGKQYVNYPEALKNQGIIKKNAYSLYLNSPSAKTGTLLFGGIDNAKYEGKLVTLPSAGPKNRLDIQINTIEYNGKTYDVNAPGNADSGSTITLLPNDVVLAVGQEIFGPGYGLNDRGVDGKCPDAKDLSFNFDGVTIKVPADDVVHYIEKNNYCEYLLQPSDEITLGDTFLRHAYLVYDLDDHKISIAQVKYTDETNISVIS